MVSSSARDGKGVLFCSDDSWACGWYRCYVPGVELKRLGYDVVMDEVIHPEAFGRFGTIVFQRKWDPQGLAAIKQAKAMGKHTVYELDDDIWAVTRNNPGYVAWGNPEILGGAVACIREVDMVTTTTPLLAERLRQFNSNVRVIPNMLPSTGWDYPDVRPQSSEHVVLGWVGSSSHFEDMRLFDGFVHQLLDKYPFVEFQFAGGSPEAPFDPHPRITRLKTTDILGYPTILEHFDIGLIPIVDNTFNRSKSDLKFVEYSKMGIPSVVSKQLPYLASVKHGENGFLANHPKDWLKFLSRLIEDPQLRVQLATRAQEFARTRTIDRGIDKWVRAYGLGEPPAPPVQEA